VAGAAVVGVGSGIGIGYGISHPGAQIPKSLHITGVPEEPIKKPINSPIDPINLGCETVAGQTVSDAQYSASNLPSGLTITSANGIGTISGTPIVEGKIGCTITVTSAKYGLFGTTTINFNIFIPNTLVISSTTLAGDPILAGACNLKIDSSSGELNKIDGWNAKINAAFAEYLVTLGQGENRITTIQFGGVSSIAANAFDGCGVLQSGGTIENIKFVQSPSGGLDSPSVGSNAFANCTNLKTMDLSSTHITSIGGGAF
jgi:hypothetical protein